MGEWVVLADGGDVFDALASNRALIRAAEQREVALVAQACDEWQIDESVSTAACERLIRGGADGTAQVGEFLALELAGLPGLSPSSAAFLIADVLNLRDRHPELWAVVHGGAVEPWKAFKVVRACATAGLSADAARWVDHQLALALGMMPWGRAVRLVEGLIVKADPAVAAERARQRREARLVAIGEHRDGGSELFARLDTEDALALRATIGRVADALAAGGSCEPVDQRRATALGVLADPAAALDLLNGVGDGKPTNRQATLVVHIAAEAVYPDTEGVPNIAPDGGSGQSGTGPESSSGPEGFDLPVSSARLAWGVLDPPADGHCEGLGEGNPPPGDVHHVARVEGVGPLDVETLRRFLGQARVTVRPVVDLNTIPAVDAYEVPARLREAVLMRSPIEVFPFSVRRAEGCDLDHTIPYDHHAPPGAAQTRLGNLGPLGRRTHRAKTAGGWRVVQDEPGMYLWTSPHGFRYLVTPDGTDALGRPPRDEDANSAA